MLQNDLSHLMYTDYLSPLHYLHAPLCLSVKRGKASQNYKIWAKFGYFFKNYPSKRGYFKDCPPCPNGDIPVQNGGGDIPVQNGGMAGL